MADSELMIEVAEHRFPGMGWKIVAGDDGNSYVCSATEDRPDRWDTAAASRIASEVASALAIALFDQDTAYVAVESDDGWALATAAVPVDFWPTLPFSTDGEATETE